MASLYKNISYYSLGLILPKAASFILLPIYTYYLSPKEYGIVGAMTAFSAFFTILITLNFERSIFRLIYDFKKEDKKEEFLGTLFIWVLVSSTIFVVIALIFGNKISQLYNSIDFYPYFIISILTVYFNVFGNIPRITLQVNEKAGQFIILGIAQFAITNISILVLVVVLEMKSEGYLLGGLVTSILFLPYFTWFTLKRIKFVFSKTIFIQVFNFSIPILPTIIAAQIIELSDRIFIERFLSAEELGLYSLSYSIAALILVFTAAFKKAYDPIFYKIANTEAEDVAKKILQSTNSLYYTVTIFLCLTISLLSKEIIFWIFDIKYYTAYQVVPFVCLSYAFAKIGGLINLSFYQNKKTLLMMYLSISSGILNLILNYFLIPKYGYFGAAYATIITYIFMLFVKYYFSKKVYFIRINLIKFFLIIIVVSSIYYLLEYQLSTSPIFSFSLKLLLILCLALIVYKIEIKNIKIIKSYV